MVFVKWVDGRSGDGPFRMLSDDQVDCTEWPNIKTSPAPQSSWACS